MILIMHYQLFPVNHGVELIAKKLAITQRLVSLWKFHLAIIESRIEGAWISLGVVQFAVSIDSSTSLTQILRYQNFIEKNKKNISLGSGMTSVFFGKLMPREQLNQLTSYLDASQVYGYDDKTARELRDFTNDRGLLREGPTFPGHKALLPYTSGQFIDCRRNLTESTINCFLAGDFRVNEQIGLTVMHTVWMREHNRIARRLRLINPHWSGEKLYQETRKIIGAMVS